MLNFNLKEIASIHKKSIYRSSGWTSHEDIFHDTLFFWKLIVSSRIGNFFELHTNALTHTHTHKTDLSTMITNLLPIDQKKGS